MRSEKLSTSKFLGNGCDYHKYLQNPSNPIHVSVKSLRCIVLWYRNSSKTDAFVWYFMLRDVYDDMKRNGVQPDMNTFNALIMGTMRGSLLRDALFFRDEMMAMGLVPEVFLFNLLISNMWKCMNSNLANQILEENEKTRVKLNGQTYVCLISAYAIARRLDQMSSTTSDMDVAGHDLNKFCFAAYIIAYMNAMPRSNDGAYLIPCCIS
ncbi:hypothetical protein V6N13_070781 [Hibiscus sabdariffa]